MIPMTRAGRVHRLHGRPGRGLFWAPGVEANQPRAHARLPAGCPCPPWGSTSVAARSLASAASQRGSRR